MKRSIILWTSSILLVFLLFYINQITGSEYPLTGVISIDNSEVLYRLERTGLSKAPIKILIQSDNQNLKGFLEWRYSDKKWRKTNLIFSDGAYSAIMPAQSVGQKIFYRIHFIQGKTQKTIPANGLIEMKIKGKIPGMLNFYYYLFLIAGMLLAVRTGMEYFNEQPKIKKLAFVTIFFFFGYLIFTPLQLSYEIGAINHFVPHISELFNLQPILFLLVWLCATIAIFQSKYSKIISLTAGLISIVILFIF